MEIINTFKEALSNIVRYIKDAYSLILAAWAGGSISYLLVKLYESGNYGLWNFTLFFIGVGTVFLILIALLFFGASLLITYRKYNQRKMKREENKNNN